MTQNKHVCAIFCWLEAAGDVISGGIERLSKAISCDILNLLALAVSE